MKMGKLIGLYALRENGELTYHVLPPEPGSEAVHVWPLREDRFDFMRIVVEAGAMVASGKRIQELVDKWKIDDDDGVEFAKRVGIPLDYYQEEKVWLADDPVYHAAATGTTALEALTKLYHLYQKETSRNGKKAGNEKAKGDA